MAVEDEWERELEAEEDLDLLFVTYDANKITMEHLNAVIAKHGFDAQVKEETEANE